MTGFSVSILGIVRVCALHLLSVSLATFHEMAASSLWIVKHVQLDLQQQVQRHALHAQQDHFLQLLAS